MRTLALATLVVFLAATPGRRPSAGAFVGQGRVRAADRRVREEGLLRSPARCAEAAGRQDPQAPRAHSRRGGQAAVGPRAVGAAQAPREAPGRRLRRARLHPAALPGAQRPDARQQTALAASGPGTVLAQTAWNKRTTCSKVAVLDTGMQYTHPDLKDNVWHNKHEIDDNGKDDDKNGYVDDYYGLNAIAGKGNAEDKDGHGTHVSGIIGARGNNALGVSGLCWEATVMPGEVHELQGPGIDVGRRRRHGVRDQDGRQDHQQLLGRHARSPSRSRTRSSTRRTRACCSWSRRGTTARTSTRIRSIRPTTRTGTSSASPPSPRPTRWRASPTSVPRTWTSARPATTSSRPIRPRPTRS